MSFNDNEKKRIEVIALFEQKFSGRKISRNLKMPSSTVAKIIKTYLERGTVARKKGSGRKKSLGKEEIKFINEKIQEDNQITAKNTRDLISNKFCKSVSQWTVSRELRLLGFYSRNPALRPLLTERHKKARYELALKWSLWTKKKFHTIIFSDECRFEVNGHDGSQKIRRRVNTRYEESNIVGTKKYGGGGVMIWGCISYAGVGKIAIIDGTMDSIGYTRLMAENLFESADLMGLSDGFLYQQDNAPCHSSKYTMRFFAENHIEVLKWPAQSPDLNPIEHVWAYMKRKLLKCVIKNRADLVMKIKEIWNGIEINFIKHLIDSMPRRIEEVVRAKGGNTRY